MDQFNHPFQWQNMTGLNFFPQPMAFIKTEYPANSTIAQQNFQQPNVATNSASAVVTSDDGQFQCSICNKRFSLRHNLVMHERIHSEEKSFKRSMPAVDQHTHQNIPITQPPTALSYIPQQFIKTKYSNATGAVEISIEQRQQNYHQNILAGDDGASNNGQYQCSVCNKRFSLRHNLINHERMHADEKSYKSAVDAQNFHQQNVAAVAAAAAASEGHFQISVHDKSLTFRHMMPERCTATEKPFIKSQPADQHIGGGVANSDGQYQITENDKKLLLRHNLMMNKIAGEKTYKCEYCEKSFVQPSNLVKHKQTHINDKPYPCPLCEKTFNQKQHVKLHERTHTGEKPYECDICLKRFGQPSNLQKHKQIHAAEKPYKCSFCEKAFAQKQNLEMHERIHTGEKPYKCDICNKDFCQLSNLTKHKLIHCTEKPFKCLLCEKSFAQKQHLNMHQNTHTGEKPYKCDYCDKTFGQPSNLQKHKQIHCEDKPYKCQQCEKCFSQPEFLKIHVETHLINSVN